MILLNNDAECEPRFFAALLEGLDEETRWSPACCSQEREPELIDSAGVVADHTLMGFDYLHGEPLGGAERAAADPLGPTGGAALYRREAFEAVGGFDERIFLYYEDLDLALRIAAPAARCRLAPGARALHAYSASLGAASGAQVRAHRLEPRLHAAPLRGDVASRALALRALACEGAICAGQLLCDHTARGSAGACAAGATAAASAPRTGARRCWRDLAPARRWPCAAGARLARLQELATLEPATPSQRGRGRGRRCGAGGGARAAGGEASARASSLPRQGGPTSGAGERRAASEPASTTRDPRQRASGMNLIWVASRLRATSRAFSAAGRSKPACQEALPTCQTTAVGNVLEAPAGDPRPHVEVDVLVEGEVALVVAAELVEELAAQQAGGAADAEDLASLQVPAAAGGSPAPRSTARPSRVSAWPAL